MGLKTTSKERTEYHLTNILKYFNYDLGETVRNDALNLYGPYVNFFQSNWAVLMKKFINHGTTIISTFGDRLENISYAYYGTTSLWPVLHLFNPQIDNPFIIPLGTEIFVPDITEIDKFFTYMSTTSTQEAGATNSINTLEF